MSLLIQYLIKLSLSLAIMWVFYQVLLRRLTFYNSNRWYLLGYSFLCFFIPLINISSVFEKTNGASNGIVHFIPSVNQYTTLLEEASHCPVPIWSTQYDKWDWISFALMTGAALLLIRFIVRLVSFLQMRRKAKLISSGKVKLYQVDQSIIPFSFGNAVFINNSLHSEAELQEIIRHEFVHVKQKHTIDIVWGEILCIINWYNPFAWLIRAAIRRNLEFIADDKAIAGGFDKKNYQYLLLKVIGNNQFSIANKFNFSSLKKRIAMMNKIKTARIHLLRFLFMLPLLAVILVSFRQINHQKENREADPAKDNLSVKDEKPVPGSTELTKGVDGFLPSDTIPDVNEKGYIVRVAGSKNNAIVVVRDRDGKLIEKVPYEKWKQNEESFIDKYGEYEAPPVPPLPPSPPTPPPTIELPENVKRINVDNTGATVTLKDGTIEKYDFKKPEESAKFQKKYGGLIPTPPTPPERPRGDREVSAVRVDGVRIADDFEITEDHKAHMRLKDGTVEEYDLANEKEKKAFEAKYGRVIAVPAKVEGSVVGRNIISDIEPGEAVSIDGQAILAPTRVRGDNVQVISDDFNIISDEEEILVTVTKKTTQQELETFVKKMKERGYFLKFNNTHYDKGVLTHIDGTMKVKDSNSNFSATDFNKLILSTVKDGDRIYLHVKIADKEVI